MGRNRRYLIGAATFSAIGAFALPAAAVPTTGITYTSTTSATCNHACIDGFQFTVPLAGITVVDLGAFDVAQGGTTGAANNLPAGVVDLFSSAGAVLATANVGFGTSGTQVGLFEFIDLTTPLGLGAGNYIVAYAPNGGANYAFSSSPEGGSLGAGISNFVEESCDSISGDFNGASCSLSTASLKAGTTSIPNSDLGGNLEFNVGLPAPTGVPEPLTLAIFGAGLVGAAAMRRRKP